VEETIDDLFTFRENVEETLRQAVDVRRTELVEERRQMREELASAGDGQATAWAEGIDEVAEGSFDVLAMTVFYPA
jgi:hypothetical protein